MSKTRVEWAKEIPHILNGEIWLGHFFLGGRAADEPLLAVRLSESGLQSNASRDGTLAAFVTQQMDLCIMHLLLSSLEVKILMQLPDGNI